MRIETVLKRIPKSLLPVINEIIANHKKQIKEQKQILKASKPKPKTKKELFLENQELKKKLQMQINLPSEK